VAQRVGDGSVQQRGLGQQQAHFRQLVGPPLLQVLLDRLLGRLPRLRDKPYRQQQLAAVLQQCPELRVVRPDPLFGLLEVVEGGWYVAAQA
jgi:hypothetical protein